jgi:hypothetical protein
MLLALDVLHQQRPNVTLKKQRFAQKRFQIYRETISPVHNHVVITNSSDTKEN